VAFKLPYSLAGALPLGGITLQSNVAANFRAVEQVLVQRFASGATADRPSAVVSGVGFMWYDTSLVIPIWSDGTVWRDAAGTAV
jgi:hypothetical protein